MWLSKWLLPIDETKDIIDKINRAKPDILFIGIPTPLKELFAYENRANLKVPMVQGVGGSFDVLAGLVQRAPVWMQEWGLEWFFRVLQEPKRMFWRYLSTNTEFLILYLQNIIKFHLRNRKS